MLLCKLSQLNRWHVAVREMRFDTDRERICISIRPLVAFFFLLWCLIAYCRSGHLDDSNAAVPFWCYSTAQLEAWGLRLSVLFFFSINGHGQWMVFGIFVAGDSIRCIYGSKDILFWQTVFHIFSSCEQFSPAKPSPRHAPFLPLNNSNKRSLSFWCYYLFISHLLCHL